MANTTITPNMTLPVPVPGTDPGPDWANNIVADMYAIDGHDHTSGKGVAITPSGLNVNADFPLNNNNLISAKSVRFTAQSPALSGATNIGCLYESGVDLYYNDGAGNQIRITASGSVTGSTGTITGLPSGTASASFSGGTFTFNSATSTPATMAVGPLVIGRSVASSKTVTLAPNSGQASDYNVTFPAALPGGAAYMTIDNTGALNFNGNGSTGSNSVVLSSGPTIASPTITSATITGPTIQSASMTGNTTGIGIVPLGAVIPTFPALSGAYVCTATTTADSNGFVKCNGQTIADGSSPMNGVVVPNINNTIFLAGSTTSNTSGGAATVSLSSANLGAHTHGSGSFATSVGVTGGTASLTGSTSFASTTHGHGISHTHIWGFQDDGVTDGIYTKFSSDVNSTSMSTSDHPILDRGDNFTITGGASAWKPDTVIDTQLYTSGAIDTPAGSGINAGTGNPSQSDTIGISNTAASMTGSNTVSGTSSSTGSGTAFSILPTYITALYVMRVK